jgi:hypothetical protein
VDAVDGAARLGPHAPVRAPAPAFVFPRGIPLCLVLAALPACSSRTSSAALICADVWDVKAGKLDAPAPDCSAFTGTTAALPPFDYWAARYEYKKPIPASFTMSAKFTRPAADADMPVELVFRGGHFGVASKRGYFFWESDKHWTGWQPTNAWGDGENELMVRQNGAAVEGYVNGTLVGTFTLASQKPSVEAVGLFLKSNVGTPAKTEIRSFSVK